MALDDDFAHVAGLGQPLLAVDVPRRSRRAPAASCTSARIAYGDTEAAIRELLGEPAAPAVTPDGTIVRNEDALTPELYLGTTRGDHRQPRTPGVLRWYEHQHRIIDESTLGGEWRVQPEYAEAGAAATIRLRYFARRVYAVLAPPASGAVDVRVSGAGTGADGPCRSRGSLPHSRRPGAGGGPRADAAAATGHTRLHVHVRLIGAHLRRFRAMRRVLAIGVLLVVTAWVASACGGGTENLEGDCLFVVEVQGERWSGVSAPRRPPLGERAGSGRTPACGDAGDQEVALAIVPGLDPAEALGMVTRDDVVLVRDTTTLPAAVEELISPACREADEPLAMTGMWVAVVGSDGQMEHDLTPPYDVRVSVRTSSTPHYLGETC